MTILEQARQMADAASRQIRRLQRKRVAYSQTFRDGKGELHPNARIVLKDLRRAAGIDKGGIVISPISRMVDPHATAYRAGQRDLYLRVVKMLGLDEAITEDDIDE
ncbi:MAG TPA: hypothetical protein PLL92_14470 [Alicycliphilus sp.]|nr:hypothetical protein [Alicycliphilus sp.]